MKSSTPCFPRTIEEQMLGGLGWVVNMMCLLGYGIGYAWRDHRLRGVTRDAWRDVWGDAPGIQGSLQAVHS